MAKVGRLPGDGAPPRCPACQAPNDGYASSSPEAELAPPEPGDCSICAYCATLAVYEEMGGRLGLRRPTTAELQGFLADDSVRDALRFATQLSKQLPRREVLRLPLGPFGGGA